MSDAQLADEIRKKVAQGLGLFFQDLKAVAEGKSLTQEQKEAWYWMLMTLVTQTDDEQKAAVQILLAKKYVDGIGVSEEAVQSVAKNFVEHYWNQFIGADKQAPAEAPATDTMN